MGGPRVRDVRADANMCRAASGEALECKVLSQSPVMAAYLANMWSKGGRQQWPKRYTSVRTCMPPRAG
eukprot:scaffold262511_cov28-Tisochrysis_lutea.AAC.1